MKTAMHGVAFDDVNPVARPRHALSIAEGETGEIPFTQYHANGSSLYDLTNCIVLWTVWSKSKEEPLISRQLDVSSLGVGAFLIEVGDTLGYRGTYKHDVWLTDKNFDPYKRFQVCGVATLIIGEGLGKPDQEVTVPPQQLPLGQGPAGTGIYDNDASYVVGSIVAYTVLGITTFYVCIANTTGNLPTDATFWTALQVGISTVSVTSPLTGDGSSGSPISAAAFLARAGGTMAGDIAMAGNSITTTDLSGQVGTFLARPLAVTAKQLAATWNGVNAGDSVDTKRGTAAIGFNVNNRYTTAVSGTDEYSPNMFFTSRLLSSGDGTPQNWALQAVANAGASAFTLDYFNGNLTSPTRSYTFNASGVMTTPLGTVALLSDITGGTLQQSYTTGGAGGGTFTLSASGGGLIVKDAATPIGGYLFAVKSNDGATTYFAVTADAPDTGALTFGNGASAPLSASGFGNLAYDNVTHKFKVSANTGAYVNLALTNDAAGGDATGTLGALTNTKIQGVAVKSGTPTDTFVLTYVAANSRWEPLASSGGVTSVIAGGGVTVSSATGAVTFGTDNTVVALLAGTQTFTGTKTFGAVVFGAGATASGSTAFDLSGSSAIFKTPTGAATFGGSSNTFTNAIAAATASSFGPGSGSSAITLLFKNANTGTLSWTPSGSRTLALPDVTDTVAVLGTTQTFTKAQGVSPAAITDATNISTDASLANTFTVTLGGNRTLDNPTNLVSGFTYQWIITQGSGGQTLAYDNKFKFSGGIAPVLTTTAAAVDIISAYYNGTNLLCVFVPDVR